MNNLLLYQSSLFIVAKYLVLFSCLLILCLLMIYNAFYLQRIVHSNKKVGIHPPKYIHHLLQASSSISLITAIVIILVLILGM